MPGLRGIVGQQYSINEIASRSASPGKFQGDVNIESRVVYGEFDLPANSEQLHLIDDQKNS